MTKISNKKTLLVIFVIGIIIAGFTFGWRKTEENPQKIIINGWEFPKEEGEHSNLESEWWYFAGHLEEEGNPENKFGVTLIFQKNPPHVKINLVDGNQQKNFSSVIEINQYDLLSEEKLAIKKGENFWLEENLFEYRIHFEFENKKIDLNLDSIKKPFIRNAAFAFYYQQTRVKVFGKLSFPGQEYKVKGWRWIDHQGFRAKAPFSLSWHWYAIQLNNNTEIEFTTYPTINFNTSDLFLYKDDQIEKIKNDSYSIDDIDYWVDPETNYEYPVRFRLKIPAKNVNLEVAVITNNQVVRGTPQYYKLYEGSCWVTGLFDDQTITGRAQFELGSLIK